MRSVGLVRFKPVNGRIAVSMEYVIPSLGDGLSVAYSAHPDSIWSVIDVDTNSYESLDSLDMWCVREQMVAEHWHKDYVYHKPIILIKRL